ncbi:PRD domain-containing protein [Streptomyces winkii]|uniref:PRD domain-containing protein n=1 Tax=Streptomyces winkii TaxID=3051178 RepID=UPI0028D579B8|nr:PRD domain-containing protein [Streptomyces sp. DSM 40971]
MEETPDEKLALRIRLFRENGQVRAEVADFVERELAGLARAGLPVSEETAGMLTSHLMMALNRLLNGEPLDDPAAGDHMAAELADRPDAVRLAGEIAARAERELGTVPLPASETGYLALHLAVLAQREAAGEPGSVPDGAAGVSVQRNGEQP